MTELNISDVQSQLLLQVKEVCSSDGQASKDLPDDLMSALHFVFQGTLQPALDILDHNGVTKVTSPSGRTVFQVVGSSSKLYTCFPPSKYCTCPSYTYAVLKRRDITMCKHVLATFLGAAMGTHEEVTISDSEMTKLHRNSHTHNTSE
ncbi:zinc finger SWIM domain-containing protein 7-like [Ptychodera flava]|uniref:zinc finger SWIM domain-containing protein 7-like n=1 Tax=Ptychodera flava TaxID=63121 RepID=UPI00396A728E